MLLLRNTSPSTYLCDGPGDEDGGVLRVRQHSLGSIEATEVGRTIDDDTLNGHVESTVQTDDTVRLDRLLQTVEQTVELTLAGTATNVRTETGTGEVERVHEAERRGTGGTAGSEVTQEVAPELGVLVDAAEEHLFVHILEREVQGLGREVTDHVGQVTAPEGTDSLLLRDANEAIDDTCRLSGVVVGGRGGGKKRRKNR